MTFDTECPPSSWAIACQMWDLWGRIKQARLTGPLEKEYMALLKDVQDHRNWVKTRNFGT